MKSNQLRIFKFVMLKEGGSTFTTPSYDGQWTKYGVTLPVLQEHLKNKNLTSDAIKNLTEEQALDVYDKKFWDPMLCDDWASGKDLLVFDMAFFKGPGAAIECIQKAVGFTGKDLDNKFGPKTKKALQNADFDEFNDKYYDAKIDYLKKRPNAAKFIKGWTNRVNDTKAIAKALHMEAETLGGDVDFQTADILIAEVEPMRN